MVHLTRELVGGQLAVTPDTATMTDPRIKDIIEEYYSVGDWSAQDRSKLLYFARDLLNSSYAGHRLAFEFFAQSPPFAQYNHLYSNYDFDRNREMVRRAANLSLKNQSEKALIN
jgi:4-hydroxyphenylacetate 3-monooxygenase